MAMVEVVTLSVVLPDVQERYQTAGGAKGQGLHDMAGNVWRFVDDWHERGYCACSRAGA